MTVRLLAISCASRAFMSGGAVPYLRASSIPRRVSARGMMKSLCILNGLEKRGGGGGTREIETRGPRDGVPTPCRVFHRQTPCSVLEHSPLLHPTAAAALICMSPSAATDGTGLALNGGVGGTLWGSRRGGPVMNVIERRQQAVLMACVFDEVLQLSSIARARIAGEGVQRLGGDGIDAFAPMLRIGVYEVAHQQGIIRGLLIQGGHDDREHVQPIIQILS